LHPLFKMVSLFAIAALPTKANAQDWRDEIGTFRIGVMAANEMQSVRQRLNLFRETLANNLDISVEILPFADWVTLSNAQMSGHVDYAIHTALSYTMTQISCSCLEPLVVPSFSSGAKTTNLIFLAQENAQVDFDKASASRFGIFHNAQQTDLHLVQAFMQVQGKSAALIDQNNLQFLDEIDEAKDALAKGDVDAVLGWSTLAGDISTGYSHGTWRDFMQDGDYELGDLSLAWRSPSIPNGPHVVSRSLPSEAKKQLKRTLLEMHVKDPAAYDAVALRYFGGFKTIDPTDFIDLKEALQAYKPTDSKLEQLSN